MAEQNGGGRSPFPSWYFDAILAFDLGLAEQCIFIAVWKFTDKDRIGWPSQRTIAETANTSRSTAQKALDRLIEVGMLLVVSEGHGRGQSARYQIPKRIPHPRGVRFLPTPARTSRPPDGASGWHPDPEKRAR